MHDCIGLFLFCTMNPDLISIIMPAKNEEAFIADCIDSILQQDYIHWELLVVDDHSSDNTWNILSTYQRLDPRIKALQNKGTGIISALQSGYAVSSGMYITRMDADDLMTTDKLSSLKNRLQDSTSPSLATAHVKYFSAEGMQDGYLKYESWLNDLCTTESHYKHIYKECVIPSPCWMVDRETFDMVGGFKMERYPEDYDLAFRFYQHQIPIVPVQKVLHHWRDYPTRTSRTSPDYSDNRFLAIKMDYFMLIDYDSSRSLILWGAGKKGKTLARLLIDRATPFRWISNNDKKIGKNIYGQIIQSDTQELPKDAQVILAIANPEEKKQAIQDLKSQGLTLKSSLFPFC